MRRLLVLVCLFRGDVPAAWTPSAITYADGEERPILLQRCSRCGRKVAWKTLGYPD